ncbi:MAG TPA: ATP-binding cassette domain-containing protein [Solirubrobacteraceae bacterium]
MSPADSPHGSGGAGRRRIEIEFPSADVVEAQFDDFDVRLRAGAGDAEPEVVAQGAAVVVDGRRVPVPPDGLVVGAGDDADVRVAGRGTETRVEVRPTEDGHALIATAGDAVFINGERLLRGERRPLGRGDAVAIGATLLHYIPAGGGRLLAPVAPVDAGRFRTSKPEFTIGRAAECDLVLDHPTVSLRHAVVRDQRGQATIEDAGATTGVRVNGELVRRAPLRPGDQIAVGPFRIVFDGEAFVDRRAPTGLPVVAVGVRIDVEDGGTILHPTTLHLRPGELVAIIGESGAGKSTLLKALSGVREPSAGAVMAGGEDVRTRLTDVGYVPQFDTVHGALTVREVLDYAAQLRLPPDTTEAERAERVTSVIEQLGLEERADVRVERLSGGQRKRVAVGTELLHSPGALFLDEPTTGLDPGLERRMTELFRSLSDTGQTVALVTHATASLGLCDRVIVMARGGHLCYDGPPDELLSTFGVDDDGALYVRLAQDDPRALAAEITGRNGGPPPPLPPLRSQRVRLPVQQSLTRQTQVLARRYATLLARDRKHLKSALLQVPILGVLTALLFESGVFSRPEAAGGEAFAREAAQVLFLMVTIAIWLGSINAAREIVKERNVVARELAVGVDVRAYLASKLVVLLTFATIQTGLFAAIVLTLRPVDGGPSASAGLLAVLVLSTWAAVLLGLLVSAAARSEDQATGVIPLLLAPQLLCGGAIVTLQEMSGVMSVLSALIPARWSFAAAGSSLDMNERIAEDQAFATASRYGDSFFELPFAGFVGIMILFAVAMAASIVYLLRRPDAD